jgi:NADH dehydrogenase
VSGTRRILILGGGFAGLQAARRLERLLRRLAGVEVMLVSRENFFAFTPMLHEVAASDLDLTHVVSPIRALLKRTRFFLGDVEAVDLEARRVRVAHGSGPHRHGHELDYDQLVIALGSTTNFFGLPGLEQHALTLKSLGDAIALRNRLIAGLEEADTECAQRLGIRTALTGFVVAGGGFAGVETLAALNDFAREALRAYPNLSERDLRMLLVEAGDRLLPELDARLGAYARRKLERRGVEVRLGTRVVRADSDAVELSDGTRIPTRTLLWTAGTAPHPLLASLACAKQKGRLLVTPELRVVGQASVWALGDCAWIPDSQGNPYPPTAQHALRQGDRVARNIAALLQGEAPQPFAYRMQGQLAALGRRAGVAQLFGLRFSGFVAWGLWRAIYLAKLPRAEKKLRVALDWALDLLFAKDLVQYSTGQSPEGP